MLPPRVLANTYFRSTPPLLKVTVNVRCTWRIVQHRADAAPKERVYETSGSFPAEVRVVEIIVFVEHAQILRQLFRWLEIVNVDEWMRRWCARIVLRGTAHHDWDNFMSEICNTYVHVVYRSIETTIIGNCRHWYCLKVPHVQLSMLQSTLGYGKHTKSTPEYERVPLSAFSAPGVHCDIRVPGFPQPITTKWAVVGRIGT